LKDILVASKFLFFFFFFGSTGVSTQGLLVLARQDVSHNPSPKMLFFLLGLVVENVCLARMTQTPQKKKMHIAECILDAGVLGDI
jgi:hypothetical protein